ncbi:hypothetical protein TspCOW1_21610 [Thiohalobacter sp. COW1]|nr:hypothetical protein TspCOW1_21610 [Thiohalobacter sp. COW1]
MQSRRPETILSHMPPITPAELSSRLETAAQQLRQIRFASLVLMRIGESVFGGRSLLRGPGGVVGRRRGPGGEDESDVER